MRSKGDRYRRLQAWVDGAKSNDHLCALVESHYKDIFYATNDDMLEVLHYTFLRMSAREINDATFLQDWRKLFIATRKEIEKLEIIDKSKIENNAYFKESAENEY